MMVKAADGVAVMKVVPWRELSDTKSLMTARLGSIGDTAAGGGISFKRKRKADKV